MTNTYSKFMIPPYSRLRLFILPFSNQLANTPNGHMPNSPLLFPRSEILTELLSPRLILTQITNLPLLVILPSSSVEAEVSRLEQLRSSKLRDLVMKKRLELDEICRQAHMVAESQSATESTEDIESESMDPECLLAQIELQIARAKEEALSRKEILDQVEKWLAACQEECWLEEYNKDDKRYHAGRGTTSFYARTVQYLEARERTRKAKTERDQKKLKGKQIVASNGKKGCNITLAGAASDRKLSLGGAMLRNLKPEKPPPFGTLRRLSYQIKRAPSTANNIMLFSFIILCGGENNNPMWKTPKKPIVVYGGVEDKAPSTMPILMPNTPSTMPIPMPNTPPSTASVAMLTAKTPPTPTVPSSDGPIEYSFEEGNSLNVLPFPLIYYFGWGGLKAQSLSD
ncbi:hypothetical protein L484_022434 [Morus notabilis]|uniref:Uncharacterized protein n=1 Tax=Morus notabilis TaxID=981085 RepID=W9QS25_9ROSA|nr:hypothetical protein L484_022434 [Morus notabilis]